MKRQFLQAELEIGNKNLEHGPWPGGSVGESVVPVRQGCGFNPRSGHKRESTDECISKWNNKIDVSFPPLSSLSIYN